MKKFLLVAYSTMNFQREYVAINEFASVEEANRHIIVNVTSFLPAGDSCGTRFITVPEGEYVTKEGKFFVTLKSINQEKRFTTPEEVREELEPF